MLKTPNEVDIASLSSSWRTRGLKSEWASYIFHQRRAQNSSGGPKCHFNPTNSLISFILSTYPLERATAAATFPEEDRRPEPPTAAMCWCHYSHLALAQRRRAGLLAATAAMQPLVLACPVRQAVPRRQHSTPCRLYQSEHSAPCTNRSNKEASSSPHSSPLFLYFVASFTDL